MVPGPAGSARIIFLLCSVFINSEYFCVSAPRPKSIILRGISICFLWPSLSAQSSPIVARGLCPSRTYFLTRIWELYRSIYCPRKSSARKSCWTERNVEGYEEKTVGRCKYLGNESRNYRMGWKTDVSGLLDLSMWILTVHETSKQDAWIFGAGATFTLLSFWAIWYYLG